MYGMIHKAMQQMLQEQLPAGAVSRLAELRQRCSDLFISASEHTDEVTLELLEKSADDLQLPLEDFMFRFGEYWITFADHCAYAPLMRIAGATFPEFIENLDRLHVGVREAIPNARTPRFRVVQADNTEITVAYYSTRAGLEPFVTGLLCGLLRRFGLDGTVKRTSGGSNDEIWFRVTFGAQAE